MEKRLLYTKLIYSMNFLGVIPLLLFNFLSIPDGFSKTEKVSFPDSFEWCVATASHQIEGNNKDSDWWEFERRGKTIENEDRSTIATDHWNRLEEDTQILVDLGVKTYRFSLEWAKIEPQPGKWNQEAIDHYKKEILLLKKNNIKPFITLNHFSIPYWFAKKGGWASPQAPIFFNRYVSKVFENLGELGVESWVTFNEPVWNLISGYVLGAFPPGKKDLKLLAPPIVGVVRSHAKAYKTLHELAKKKKVSIKVGLVKALNIFETLRKWNPLDHYARSILERVYNLSLLEVLQSGRLKFSFPTIVSLDEEIKEAKGTLDFLGVNFYTRLFVKFTFSPPFIKTETVAPKDRITEMHWEVYPEGLYRVVTKAHKMFPKLPLFISENGIADKTDKKRIPFIKDHLYYVYKLLQERVPILGYCYWTLIDNFEWAHGYRPRFGLYELNLKTLERSPRPSAIFYKNIIKKKGFTYERKGLK